MVSHPSSSRSRVAVCRASCSGRIQAVELGRLVMLSIRKHRFPFLARVADWKRFNRNSGGTMVEKCCYFFNLMRLVVRRKTLTMFCSGGVRVMPDLCMFAEGEEQQEAMAAVGDRASLEGTIPSGELVFSLRVPLGQPAFPPTEIIGLGRLVAGRERPAVGGYHLPLVGQIAQLDR